MLSFDENWKCPCWSGKLTKDCLLNPNFRNNNCKLFLPIFWELYENNIIYFIKYTTQEVTQTIDTLEKYSTAARSQTSILIIFVDVLSKIWDLFYFQNRWNKNRFTSWYDEFLATDDNKYWKSNEEIQRLNSDLFYNLRNSLLHSFALPQTDKTWINIALNRNAPESEIVRLKKLNNIVITPVELFNFIQDWVDLMLKKMESKKEDIDDYYRRIINVWKAIEEEWAVILSEKDFITKK